jgi:hypothetical protein
MSLHRQRLTHYHKIRSHRFVDFRRQSPSYEILMNEPDVLDEPAPPPPVPRWRRLRWLGVVLLVLFTACGGFYAFMLHRFNTDLDAAVAEADRLEPDGWSLEAIEAHRKVVSDEENAALVIQGLKSKLPANWPPPRPVPVVEVGAVPEAEVGAVPEAEVGAAPAAPGASQEWVDTALADLPPPVQLDAALLRDLRDNLKAAGPGALDEAHKLPGLRDGRFPIHYTKDSISTLINSQDARAGAILLHHEAVLLAQEGKADKALEATRGIVVSGRAIGDEPFIISQLIRMACQIIALQTLERVLAQGEPSADELKKMQELLELEVADPLLLIAIRGERAGQHQLMKALKSGDAKLSTIAGSGGGSAFADVAGSTLARGSHARLLRLLTEYVEVAKLPPEQQIEPIKQLDLRVKRARVEYDVVVALLMPAMMKVSDANRRNQAMLRCAIVAVAAERYRSQHQRWPETLDDLTRDHLKAVPTDPYDGKPLRYKRLPDGIIVYSVGPDGEDNGGARNRANLLAKGTDYGFRLWDVAERRQPAAEVLPAPQEAPGP